MRKPAPARFPDLCDGSGVAIALTWEDARERYTERACPACGRLLVVRAIVGGAAARKIDAIAAANVPPHNRRKEGQAP